MAITNQQQQQQLPRSSGLAPSLTLSPATTSSHIHIAPPSNRGGSNGDGGVASSASSDAAACAADTQQQQQQQQQQRSAASSSLGSHEDTSPPSYRTSQVRDRFFVVNPDLSPAPDATTASSTSASPIRRSPAQAEVSSSAQAAFNSPSPTEQRAAAKASAGSAQGSSSSSSSTAITSGPSSRSRSGSRHGPSPSSSNSTTDSLLQMLTDKSPSTDVSSSQPASADVPCIYGFPLPPGSRVVELVDAIPTGVPAASDPTITMPGCTATPDGQLHFEPPSPPLTIFKDEHAASAGSLIRKTTTTSSSINAWRREVLDCARAAEVTADRIAAVRQGLSQCRASDFFQSHRRGYERVVEAKVSDEAGDGAHDLDINLEQPLASVDSFPQGPTICNGAPDASNGCEAKLTPLEEEAEVVVDGDPRGLLLETGAERADGERCFSLESTLDDDRTPELGLSSSMDSTFVDQSIDSFSSFNKRRGTFGQAGSAVPASDEPSTPASYQAQTTPSAHQPLSQPAFVSQPQEHASPSPRSDGSHLPSGTSSETKHSENSIASRLAASRSAGSPASTIVSPSKSSTHTNHQRRRPATSTAVSPFSLSHTNHTLDATEFIADDFERGAPAVSRSKFTESDVPTSVIRQLLDATVGQTQMTPTRNGTQQAPLQVLHRELAKLRIKTLLDVIGPTTSEVVVDLIGSQVVAYLYFVEDSELLAWTTKTIYQRRDAPARQWSQLCSLLKEYRPIKPPLSNFSSYLAAPARTAILRHLGFPDSLPSPAASASVHSSPVHTTPPASPWRKHLHIFSRKSHIDPHAAASAQAKDGHRHSQHRSKGARGSDQQQQQQLRGVHDDDIIDSAATASSSSGLSASELGEFIATHLKMRAVDCLSLDVLVAISNLCVHRIFAPVLLRRLLALFALGDTENGFLPVAAEVKLLRSYRDNYLRPQSSLLRARIKEFSPEMEVEAMLRTIEAATNPRLLLPSQPSPSSSSSHDRPTTASGAEMWPASLPRPSEVDKSASVLRTAYASTPLYPFGGVGESPAPPRDRSGSSNGDEHHAGVEEKSSGGGKRGEGADEVKSTTRRFLSHHSSHHRAEAQRSGKSHGRSTSASVKVPSSSSSFSSPPWSRNNSGWSQHPSNGMQTTGRSASHKIPRRPTTSYSPPTSGGSGSGGNGGGRQFDALHHPLPLPLSFDSTPSQPSPLATTTTTTTVRSLSARKAPPLDMVTAIDQLVSLRMQQDAVDRSA